MTAQHSTAQHSTAQHSTVWKWAVVGYLIVLHLCLAALILKTDFISRVKAKLSVVVVAAPPDPHFTKMLAYHQQMDESVPEKAVVFLGDSFIQGLATAAVSPYAVNYGIGGENTAQLLDAIPTYKSLMRANAIVLAIGINDLGQKKKTGLNDRYQTIVETLPGKTPLIWSSVMPVTKVQISLSDIADANDAIKALCEKRGNCIFVDTWGFLADRNGKAINRFFLDDGVHLSPEGYKAWITALRQAVQVALADAHGERKGKRRGEKGEKGPGSK